MVRDQNSPYEQGQVLILCVLVLAPFFGDIPAYRAFGACVVALLSKPWYLPSKPVSFAKQDGRPLSKA